MTCLKLGSITWTIRRVGRAFILLLSILTITPKSFLENDSKSKVQVISLICDIFQAYLRVTAMVVDVNEPPVFPQSQMTISILEV